MDKCLRSIPGVDLDEAYEWVRRSFIRLFDPISYLPHLLLSYTSIVQKKSSQSQVHFSFLWNAHNIPDYTSN